MKKIIMDAIQRVADRELFEDGLSADLHERDIDTKTEAFLLGRYDAIREVRETLEAEFAKQAPPAQEGARESVAKELGRQWAKARSANWTWDDYHDDDKEHFRNDADRILAILQPAAVAVAMEPNFTLDDAWGGLLESETGERLFKRFKEMKNHDLGYQDLFKDFFTEGFSYGVASIPGPAAAREAESGAGQRWAKERPTLSGEYLREKEGEWAIVEVLTYGGSTMRKCRDMEVHDPYCEEEGYRWVGPIPEPTPEAPESGEAT